MILYSSPGASRPSSSGFFLGTLQHAPDEKNIQKYFFPSMGFHHMKAPSSIDGYGLGIWTAGKVVFLNKCLGASPLHLSKSGVSVVWKICSHPDPKFRYGVQVAHSRKKFASILLYRGSAGRSRLPWSVHVPGSPDLLVATPMAEFCDPMVEMV